MSNTPRRILVTGASGFIGGHLCEALARTGARVRAMVRRTSDVSQLAGVDVDLCYGDLTDESSLRRACKEIDVVVHPAAAVGSFGAWEHFYQTGVLGTERLIDAASAAGASRFVHISSIAVYGLKDHRGRRITEDTPLEHDPQSWNHYVREKVMSEEALWRAHEAGRIRATCLRPCLVVGRRDRNAIPRLVELLRLPVTALPGAPKNRLPLITIDDCTDGIVRAVNDHAAVGRAYNLVGDTPITIAEFFGHIARHAKLPAPKLYLPTRVMVPAVGMLEGAWKLLRRPGEPVATRIAIVVSGYDYEIDTARAHRELGFRPTDAYEQAVADALEMPSAVRPGHGHGSAAA